MTHPSEPRIEIADPPREGVVVLELAGELDLAVQEQFRVLAESVAADRPSLVVVDVTAVEFMDSTMLRELLRANRTAEDAGSRLVVAGAQPAVRRLLDLTGTAAVLTLADSREAALAD